MFSIADYFPQPSRSGCPIAARPFGTFHSPESAANTTALCQVIRRCKEEIQRLDSACSKCPNRRSPRELNIWRNRTKALFSNPIFIGCISLLPPEREPSPARSGCEKQGRPRFIRRPLCNPRCCEPGRLVSMSRKPKSSKTEMVLVYL